MLYFFIHFTSKNSSRFLSLAKFSGTVINQHFLSTDKSSTFDPNTGEKLSKRMTEQIEFGYKALKDLKVLNILSNQKMNS